MIYDEINPDIFEIILSETFEVGNLLRAGYMPQHPISYDTHYQTLHILYECSIKIFDIDTMLRVYDGLYPDTPPYKTSEIVKNTADKLRLRGVNMDLVKFSVWEHQTMEHFVRMYEKLVAQTNDLSETELGERVIIVPGEMPKNFDGIEQMFESLIKEESESLPPINEMDLTLEKLTKYREKFDACIEVSRENRRLYTRGRFLMNMLLELQDYTKYFITSEQNIKLDELNYFLGRQVSPVLRSAYSLTYDEHGCPVFSGFHDAEGYPVFSYLYTHGSVPYQTYPTTQADTCFCGKCPKISYSLYLYESNTRKMYVFLILHDTDYTNFFDYVNNRHSRCYFEMIQYIKKHPDVVNELVDIGYGEYLPRPPITKSAYVERMNAIGRLRMRDEGAIIEDLMDRRNRGEFIIFDDYFQRIAGQFKDSVRLYDITNTAYEHLNE